jgi:hypothetical protein
MLLVGVFAAFLFFFAFYRIDDAWWYFRFLLPAMPAVGVLEAAFLVRVGGPGRLRRVRIAAVALATCALAYGSLSGYNDEERLSVRQAEQKYPALRRSSLPRSTAGLVVCMQHSGSIRYTAPPDGALRPPLARGAGRHP